MLWWDTCFLLLLAPESRSRRRLQFAAAPLQGKSFFLHVQSAAKARELEKKLKELGGVSRYVYSWDISRCVWFDAATLLNKPRVNENN